MKIIALAVGMLVTLSTSMSSAFANELVRLSCDDDNTYTGSISPNGPRKFRLQSNDGTKYAFVEQTDGSWIGAIGRPNTGDHFIACTRY